MYLNKQAKKKKTLSKVRIIELSVKTQIDADLKKKIYLLCIFHNVDLCYIIY